MKVVELHISVHECIKYDGATNRIELTAVKLDDGRVLTLEEVEDGGAPEVRDFVVKASVQVADVGWVYTSNPDVYGYPEETFELCGVQVSSEDVNEYCVDPDDKSAGPGPFVLDLTKPAELVESRLEGSSHDCNASSVVLYYAGVPTRDQVVADLVANVGVRGLSCNTEDKFFSYEEFPTKVSERAKLRRYECNPCW